MRKNNASSFVTSSTGFFLRDLGQLVAQGRRSILLNVDGNGDSKGFGKKSEGGMIADLPNDTILIESDVLIGV